MAKPSVKDQIIPVLIIGGGAAGLAAAIEAGRFFDNHVNKLQHQKQPVLLLESQQRVGRKILATGNGRCNLSHEPLTSQSYHSTQPDFPFSVLKRFNAPETRQWFRQLGLISRVDDDGRVFPYSYQAAAVLDILRLQIEQLPIAVQTDKHVDSVRKEKQGFSVRTADGALFHANRVILATGGLAAPAFGCDGSGYIIMTKFGHQVIEPLPALVQICTQKEDVRGLDGIRIEGTATLEQMNQIIGHEQGEILFTSYGLSGPPILQLSRGVQQALRQGGKTALKIRIDFLPEMTEPEIVQWLEERRRQDPGRSLEHYWTGLLPKKAGQRLIKKTLGVSLSNPVVSLDDHQVKQLASMAKNDLFSITGTRGWREAQVTDGGLSVASFNPETMESTLIPGLYAAGEILDVDAACGGFNLQWAWSSGRCAGYEAAASVLTG